MKKARDKCNNHFIMQKYLEECIHSVKNQNFEHPIEIVLIDDGSSDGSSEIVKKLIIQILLSL